MAYFFFQPLRPQLNGETLVSAQVGVLLLGDLGVGREKENPGEILDFHLPFLSQSATMPFLLRVKNTSLAFFTAKPILHIKPLFGEEHLQFLEEKVIFPGKIRRWENPLTLEKLGIGIYQVTLQVSTGKGNSIQTTRTLLIFPWVPVLLTLIVLSLFVGLFKKRKRLKKALRAFFAKETQE